MKARWSRQEMAVALLLSLCLHAALLLMWPRPAAKPGTGLQLPPLSVTLVRPASQPAPPAHEPARKPQPAGKALAPSVDFAPRPAPKLAATTDVPGSLEAVPATPAAQPLQDLLNQARRQIGNIDRQLRREQPDRALQAPADTPQARLEKGITAAAKPSNTRVENIVMEDGRRMARVSGPAGTYCVIENTVGNHDGLDQMQNGTKKATTTCP